MLSSTPRQNAAQDEQHNEPSDTGSEADDQRLVLIDPGLDSAADRRSNTVAIATVAVAVAGCAVEEVLLHTTAFVRREHGRSAPERARRVVAGIGVVTTEERAQDSSTLQITAGTLSAGTGKACLVAAGAACAVGQVLVSWAVS